MWLKLKSGMIFKGICLSKSLVHRVLKTVFQRPHGSKEKIAQTKRIAFSLISFEHFFALEFCLHHKSIKKVITVKQMLWVQKKSVLIYCQFERMATLFCWKFLFKKDSLIVVKTSVEWVLLLLLKGRHKQKPKRPSYELNCILFEA